MDEFWKTQLLKNHVAVELKKVDGNQAEEDSHLCTPFARPQITLRHLPIVKSGSQDSPSTPYFALRVRSCDPYPIGPDLHAHVARTPATPSSCQHHRGP